MVTTAPSVIYKVYKENGELIELTNPTNLPDPSEIEHMEEPIVRCRNNGNYRVYRLYYGIVSAKTWTIYRNGVWKVQEHFLNMIFR